jgi:hypothetical protein
MNWSIPGIMAPLKPMVTVVAATLTASKVVADEAPEGADVPSEQASSSAGAATISAARIREFDMGGPFEWPPVSTEVLHHPNIRMADDDLANIS